MVGDPSLMVRPGSTEGEGVGCEGPAARKVRPCYGVPVVFARPVQWFCPCKICGLAAREACQQYAGAVAAGFREPVVAGTNGGHGAGSGRYPVVRFGGSGFRLSATPRRSPAQTHFKTSDPILRRSAIQVEAGRASLAWIEFYAAGILMCSSERIFDADRSGLPAAAGQAGGAG